MPDRAAHLARGSPKHLAGANTTGLAQDANDHIIYETDTGELYYDSNGNAAGGGIEFATIGVGLGLTNADFVVI